MDFLPTGSNWTNAEIDDLEITLKAPDSMGPAQEIYVDVVYIEATGEE